MFRKIFVVLLGVIVLAVSLHARQSPMRINGTVTAIEGDHVQIKDQAGKTTIVMLQKGTRYFKAEKNATKAELKVGTRVVIEVKMDDKMKMYAAEEVTISTADTKSAPPATDEKKTR